MASPLGEVFKAWSATCAHASEQPPTEVVSLARGQAGRCTIPDSLADEIRQAVEIVQRTPATVGATWPDVV